MQLIRSKEFSIVSPLWDDALFGFFVKVPKGVIYCYSVARDIFSFHDSDSTPTLLLHHPNDRFFPSSTKWRLIPELSLVLLDHSMGIDLERKSLILPLTDDLLTEYHRRTFTEKHLVDDDFLFEDYCISHKGMMGYRCLKNGKKLWDFQGRGYLYTEIYKHENRVYFCTGGSGGFFYALDIESGQQIVSVKTSGTQCVERIHNKCYFLAYDKKTSLICVDIQNGEIVESFDLPGKSTIDCRLQRIGDELHAITFQHKKGQPPYIYWHTIQL